MGWKSTIDITRKDAIEQIKVAMLGISDLSNEQLANILEELLGGEHHGHNYTIVHERNCPYKWRGEDG